MCQNVNARTEAIVLNFNGGKLPENLKNCIKKSKDKAVPGKGSFKCCGICGKVPVCLPLTLLPRVMFCHCISSNIFLRTSPCKRFELIQIFKALKTGCVVGFCF